MKSPKTEYGKSEWLSVWNGYYCADDREMGKNSRNHDQLIAILKARHQVKPMPMIAIAFSNYADQPATLPRSTELNFPQASRSAFLESQLAKFLFRRSKAQ